MRQDDKGGCLIFDEERDKARGRGLAGIAPDDMDVIRPFKEALTRFERHLRMAFNLHHDAPLQHLDEDRGMMPMHRVRTAGRVIHRQHFAFLARDALQVSGDEGVTFVSA